MVWCAAGASYGINVNAAPPSDSTSKPIVLTQRRQLFVDEFLIEKLDGLSPTLHQPVDYDSNPVIVPEQPWEHRRIPFGSIYYFPEESKFKCWYIASNIYDSRPGYRGYRAQHHVPLQESAFLCYAESTDGVRWTRPDLGLHEFRDSRHNNILLAHQGSHFDSMSVIYTPADKQWPFKLTIFQGAWPYKPDLIRKQWGEDFRFGIPRHGHYAWRSGDGIHFDQLGDGGPVLECSDRSMAWFNPDAQEYVYSAKVSHQGKRAQRYARSQDLVNWQITETYIHTADGRDHPRDEAEASYGFKYEAQHLGYCELRRIRSDTVRIDAELMVSRDGRHWQRPLRQPWLGASDDPETWRYLVVKPFANPPIQRDGQLWIYYTGKTGEDGRRPDPANDSTRPTQAICLAKLRLDGFVSLQADAQPGLLLTKPIELANDTLYVNADVRNGLLRAEIRQIDGRPIPGFTMDECHAVSGDRLRVPVSWKEKANVAELNNRPVQLRIELTGGHLYSIWTE